MLTAGCAWCRPRTLQRFAPHCQVHWVAALVMSARTQHGCPHLEQHRECREGGGAVRVIWKLSRRP
eukprot:12976281-Alexandrium_andersonii.AAC.1